MSAGPYDDPASEWRDDNAGGPEPDPEEARRQEEIASTMHQLWQQYPRVGTVSTYNPCKIYNCAYDARGDGYCARCLESELQTLIGSEEGSRYHEAIKTIREIEKKHSSPDSEVG